MTAINYKRNILAVYEQSTPRERTAGLTWYEDVRRWVIYQAGAYGVTAEAVAGVLAALSPRNGWQQNLKDTLKVLAAWRDGISPDALRTYAFTFAKCKAFEILRGDGWVNGPKVSAFADNILYPYSRSVTVDTWAYRVAVGDVNAPAPTNLRYGKYDRIAHAYLEAANEVGLFPYQLQAITWLTIQRIANRGRNRKPLPAGRTFDIEQALVPQEA